MTDAAQRLDDAQAGLQAGKEIPGTASATAAVKRTRNPEYAVFVCNETKAWVCMSEQLAAPSRQAAVLQACKDNSEPDREGEFLVIPADAVKHITRKIKQTVVDEFA